MQDMLWLVPVGAVCMILYAFYGYIFSGKRKQPAGDKVQQKSSEDSYKLELHNRDQKILKLEALVNSDKAEFEKLKQDYDALQKKLQEENALGAKLKDEAIKKGEWFQKGEEMVKKTQEEAKDLKAKLIAKEKEIQDEFSKNVDLARKLREIDTKSEGAQIENKKLGEEILKLKVQVERLNKDLDLSRQEIKAGNDALAELKKKQEHSQWVPKDEYVKASDELKELKHQLDSKKREVELKEEKILEIDQERIKLKNQLRRVEQPQDKSEALPVEEAKPIEEVKPEEPGQAQKIPEEKILELIETPPKEAVLPETTEIKEQEEPKEDKEKQEQEKKE